MSPSEPLVVRVAAETASDLSFKHQRSELLLRKPVLVGMTRWRAAFDRTTIFLAWRWALIEVDVVCIESPLEIDSNLYVIGEDPVARRRRLNLLISELRWQQPVLKFLRTA